MCSKIAQQDIKKDLDKSSGKRQSPFKEDGGIWQVWIQMAEFTPITLDHKPQALLLEKNHYAYLLMR